MFFVSCFFFLLYFLIFLQPTTFCEATRSFHLLIPLLWTWEPDITEPDSTERQAFKQTLTRVPPPQQPVFIICSVPLSTVSTCSPRTLLIDSPTRVSWTTIVSAFMLQFVFVIDCWSFCVCVNVCACVCIEAATTWAMSWACSVQNEKCHRSINKTHSTPVWVYGSVRLESIFIYCFLHLHSFFFLSITDIRAVNPILALHFSFICNHGVSYTK